MPSARAQACTAVFAAGQFLLFDTGDGTARRLEALDLPITDLTAVFLTHYHADHIADLGEVIDRSWINGRRAPLTVHGPTGVAEILDGLLAAYRLERGYRTAHHGPEVMPPAYAGATAAEFPEPVEGETVTVYEHDGVVVTAFHANHPPITPNVGYRITHAGRTVVLSGDTTSTATLLAQSRGVDLLVAEAMAMELVTDMEAANRAAGNPFVSTLLHDIRDYHTDVTDIAQLAAKAGVRRLALTHLTPPLDRPAQVRAYFRRPARAHYKGELVIGPDGTRIVI